METTGCFGVEIYRVFWCGKLRARDHLENLQNESIRNRIWWGVGVDWIDVAQDWDMWRAFVNAVVNLRVS